MSDHRESVLPPLRPEVEFAETDRLAAEILRRAGLLKEDGSLLGTGQMERSRPSSPSTAEVMTWTQDPKYKELRPPRIDPTTRLSVTVLPKAPSNLGLMGPVHRVALAQWALGTVQTEHVTTMDFPLVEPDPECCIHLDPKRIHNLPILTTEHTWAQMELPTAEYSQQGIPHAVFQAFYLPTTLDEQPSITYAVGPLVRPKQSLVEDGKYCAAMHWFKGATFTCIGNPLWYHGRSVAFQDSLRLYDPTLPPLPVDLGWPLPGAEARAEWTKGAKERRIPPQVINMWLDVTFYMPPLNPDVEAKIRWHLRVHQEFP